MNLLCESVCLFGYQHIYYIIIFLLSLHVKSKWYIQGGKWKAGRYYSFHKRSLLT